jgi:tripartite-type tricarboxylate transporter receptor subunit TctC
MFRMLPTLFSRFSLPRVITALAAASLSALTAAQTSSATAAPASGTYPSKPIRLIVPFPPGGATDIIARTLAQKLVAQLGQTVVVENRPGGGGTIGSGELLKAAPDGYTLLLGTTSTHSVAPNLYKNLGYVAERDFTPISEVASATNVLVVAPNLPVADVRQLVALARTQPDKLNYASSGNGTVVHLMSEHFKQLSNTKITHVPYKGTALAMPDVMSGQVQMIFDSIVSAIPHINSGKVRALAVTSAKRSPLLPNVPTVMESGLVGYEVNTYFGLFAPAKTPTDIVERLQKEVAKAVQSADVKERFASQGAEPVGGSPAALSSQMKSEAEKWKRVIETADVKLD